ncbi:MAG: hypothetical protein EXR27_03430 [Betaproteobacteria bacterium]|nr:hypothetical protein [Betaproteobacteria bacterium]
MAAENCKSKSDIWREEVLQEINEWHWGLWCSSGIAIYTGLVSARDGDFQQFMRMVMTAPPKASRKGGPRHG